MDKTHIITKVKIYDDHVSLYFDDEKIMISSDDYYLYHLNANKQIDEQTYEVLKKQECIFKAYRSCLRRLSIKDYSISQIRKTLLRNDLDKSDIDEIIDRLISYGLLDDDKYCESKAMYHDRSNFSYKNIRQKLMNDGIREDIINKYVDYSYEREIQKAQIIAEKYHKTVTNRSKKALKQSILYKLNSMGFTYDVAKYVTDNLDIEVKNELELLSKEYQKVSKRYSKKYEGYELRSKIYGSLLLKGFSSDDIKKVMEDDYEES